MTARDGVQNRVIHRKVKSGCITCRTRRVKCDETRPQCVRCLKYGTTCGGYLPGRKRPPSSAYGLSAQQARALVPKNQGVVAEAGSLLLQPRASLFESELEGRYFRLFEERISGEICPYFDNGAWRKMLMQACVGERSIRHAAVAIGALGRTYEMAIAGRCPANGETMMLEMGRLPVPGTTRESRTRLGLPADDSANESYNHYRHALEQYDKAIKRMRNDMSAGNQSKRTTLVMCIIIICFEAIHGNHESAAGQLQSGLRLIQDWTSSQQRSLENHPQGFASPAPDVIEDFLVQSFGRMEIQSMSVFDPRDVEVHNVLKQEGRETIQNMPSQFTSMEQARVYLDLITRRLMHFSSSIHVPRKQGGSLEKPAAQPPASNRRQATAWEDTISPMPWCDGKIPLANISSTLSSPPSVEQTSLVAELEAWMNAFTPLYELSKLIRGQDYISALTLSISCIASTISLKAAFFINETAYDKFIPEFTQICDLTETLVTQQNIARLSRRSVSPHLNGNGNGTAHSTPTPSAQPHIPMQNGNEHSEPLISFAFDIGILPPLYLVIVKCRDRALRRRALRLMEDNPRREGVWDSVATVALGRWVIGLEEAGARDLRGRSRTPGASSNVQNGGEVRRGSGENEVVDEGNIPIPEEMRVRKAAMRFDLLERRANLGCLQMDVEKRVFVMKKEVFTW